MVKFCSHVRLSYTSVYMNSISAYELCVKPYPITLNYERLPNCNTLHTIINSHTVGRVLIMWFNGGILVKSGQIANLIIAIDDPYMY